LSDFFEEFRDEIPKRGIFVPEKDASWEQDPNAYADQLERPKSCSAELCKCPNGREFNEETGPWDQQICLGCASKSVHADCLNLGEDDDIYYICELCQGKVPQCVIDEALRVSDDEEEEILNPLGFKRRGRIEDELNSSTSSRGTVNSAGSSRNKSSKRSRPRKSQGRSSRSRNRRGKRSLKSRTPLDSEDERAVKIPPNVKLYDCRVLIHRIHSFDSSSLSNFSDASVQKKPTAREEILKDWMEDSLSADSGKTEDPGTSETLFEKLKKSESIVEESVKIPVELEVSGIAEKSLSAEKSEPIEEPPKNPEIPTKRPKKPKKSRKSREKSLKFDDLEVSEIIDPDTSSTPLKFKFSGNWQKTPKSSIKKSKKKSKKPRTESAKETLCNSENLEVAVARDPEKPSENKNEAVAKTPVKKEVKMIDLMKSLNTSHEENIAPNVAKKTSPKKRKLGSSGSEWFLLVTLFS
jgi:hypothetical protein